MRRIEHVNNSQTKDIHFIWVCRNIHFDTVEEVELTDTMLLDDQ